MKQFRNIYFFGFTTWNSTGKCGVFCTSRRMLLFSATCTYGARFCWAVHNNVLRQNCWVVIGAERCLGNTVGGHPNQVCCQSNAWVHEGDKSETMTRGGLLFALWRIFTASLSEFSCVPVSWDVLSNSLFTKLSCSDEFSQRSLLMSLCPSQSSTRSWINTSPNSKYRPENTGQCCTRYPTVANAANN